MCLVPFPASLSCPLHTSHTDLLSVLQTFYALSSLRALTLVALCQAGSSLSPLFGSFLSFRSQLTWEHILSPVSSSHLVITTSPFSNSLHSSLPMTCLVCPRHLYAYCQVWLLITPHSFSNVGNKFYGKSIYKNLIFVWLWLAYCLFNICPLTYILCASELSFDYLSTDSTVTGTWKIQGSKEGRGEKRGWRKREKGREGGGQEGDCQIWTVPGLNYSLYFLC